MAAEFWGENAKDKLERVRHNAVRSGYYVDKGPTEEFEQVAAKERRRQLMFHWPLEFPEVIVKRGGFDAFVGNPPFMGGKKISGQYGVPYREFLVDDIANGSKGNADICSYFFLRASTLTRRSGTFGFVATNTICQGDTREVGLDAIVDNGFSLIQATPSAIWPGNASVQVAKVWSYFGPWNAGCVLNDLPVSRISSYLTEPGRLEGPPKRLIVNSRKSYQGAIILGTGFTMAPKEAEDLISREPKYGKVLFPFLNGVELNSSPTQQASRWVINFYDWPLSHDTAPSTYSGPVAADFPVCLEIVRKHVKPERDLKDRKVYREIWWQYAEKQTALFRAIAELKSVIVVAATSKTLAFAIVPNNCVFSNALYVFCSDDPALFAVLMGEFKRAWTFEYCSNMRTDLRYSNSDAFETFPFPTLDRRLASVGSKHSEYRSDIMVNRSEGLTATYNRFHDPDETSADIQKLRELHVEMDQAVAAAYGWTDLNLDHDFHETKQGVRFTISEAARREVLQRLLKLNHERYAEEVKQGLHGKSAKSTSKSGRGRKQKDPVVVASGEPEQQDMF